MTKETIQAITEHYQKTFELTYEMWKERNRLFVYLVLAAGIGLLLLSLPEINIVLAAATIKWLSLNDQSVIDALRNYFPFDVLPSMALIIIFYLMQRLYSTNLSVLRNYLYLGSVEDEIRAELKLTPKKVSFTREGDFYWGRRSLAQNISKWLYVIIIFIALMPFVALKTIGDFVSQNYIVGAIDVIVSILTFVYLWEYAASAQKLDVAEVPAKKSAKGT